MDGISREVKDTLEQVLVLPAYAGSFLFYLMSKISEYEGDSDMLHTWVRCIKSVQTAELYSF